MTRLTAASLVSAWFASRPIAVSGVGVGVIVVIIEEAQA